MFDDILLSNGDEVTRARIARLVSSIAGLVPGAPTKEDLQALVYSRLNRILALGNRMTPLKRVVGGMPAVAGDVGDNLALLNQDAEDIVKQLLAAENEAARLFNLTAATQNALRQKVREMAYMTTRKHYLEPFVSDGQLDTARSTAAFDFGVGMAACSFISEQRIKPNSVTIGVRSVGALSQPLAHLQDGDETTAMVWEGSQVELIFSFPAGTILNRIQIKLDTYQGLAVKALAVTPDGVYQDDLMAELPMGSDSLDGASNKFSGDYVVDFDPRTVTSLRLVLEDSAGSQQIALREIAFFARQHASSGVVQSKPFSFPALGLAEFTSSEHTGVPYTSISHQLSYDGVQYLSVSPGDIIDLGATRVWYRALLQRLDDTFNSPSQVPVMDPVVQPQIGPDFQILGATTRDMGGNLTQRAISLNVLADANQSTTSRSLKLWEVPIPGSLSVYQGSALLGPGQYVLQDDKLVFAGNDPRSNVLVRYQIGLAGQANLAGRRPYYTPRLYEASLELI